MSTDYSGGQDPANNVMVSTMNDLPGFRIERVLGECFGLTVRSRNIGSSFGSAMKSLKGGELKGQTKMLVDSRLEAMARLTEEAVRRGGNAVLASLRRRRGSSGLRSVLMAPRVWRRRSVRAKEPAYKGWRLSARGTC